MWVELYCFGNAFCASALDVDAVALVVVRGGSEVPYIYTVGGPGVAVDNTEKPLRYHRGDSVVVFQFYQQKYITLRSSCSEYSSAFSFPLCLAQ